MSVVLDTRVCLSMYSSRFIGAVDGTAASLELHVRESLSLPLPLSLFLSRLCVHNRD